MNRAFETALLSVVISPKTPGDAQRLATALNRFLVEDPALHAQTDQQTGQAIIAGMSELHLEIVVDRLRREFHIEATVGEPQVAFKETVTCSANGEGRYIKQTGGRGQYGHAKIRLIPRQPGEGYEFVDQIIGGSIPKEFIKPIDEGIKEALTRGILAGYPIDDVRVELYDGSYHDVDSSETAFKIAASMAFQDAAKKARPVLLEPVMRVEVVAPKDYRGDVIDSFSIRRGSIEAQEERDGTLRVRARVPLSEMFGYASDLRSRTDGRGSYTMQLEQYQPFEADNGDDSRDSFVGAPRRPTPKLRDSSVALPEPDND